MIKNVQPRGRWGSNFWSTSESVTWHICRFWSTRIFHRNLRSRDFKSFKFRFWSSLNISKWTKSKISNSLSNPAFGPKAFWSTSIFFELGLKIEQKLNSITWSFISKRSWGIPKVKRHTYTSLDYLLILNWTKNWTPRRSYHMIYMI